MSHTEQTKSTPHRIITRLTRIVTKLQFVLVLAFCLDSFCGIREESINDR